MGRYVGFIIVLTWTTHAVFVPCDLVAALDMFFHFLHELLSSVSSFFLFFCTFLLPSLLIPLPFLNPELISWTLCFAVYPHSLGDCIQVKLLGVVTVSQWRGRTLLSLETVVLLQVKGQDAKAGAHVARGAGSGAGRWWTDAHVHAQEDGARIPGWRPGDDRRVMGGWLAARRRGGGRAPDMAEGHLATRWTLLTTFPKGRNVSKWKLWKTANSYFLVFP